jgi:hypothetical protein
MVEDMSTLFTQKQRNKDKLLNHKSWKMSESFQQQKHGFTHLVQIENMIELVHTSTTHLESLRRSIYFNHKVRNSPAKRDF